MEKKEYKKFDDYTNQEIMGMAKALVRHHYFNTTCTITGEKIGKPFSQDKNDPSKFYYNTESYEARMAKRQGGQDIPADKPADLDELINF